MIQNDTAAVWIKLYPIYVSNNFCMEHAFLNLFLILQPYFLENVFMFLVWHFLWRTRLTNLWPVQKNDVMCHWEYSPYKIHVSIVFAFCENHWYKTCDTRWSGFVPLQITCSFFHSSEKLKFLTKSTCWHDFCIFMFISS